MKTEKVREAIFVGVSNVLFVPNGKPGLYEPNGGLMAALNDYSNKGTTVCLYDDAKGHDLTKPTRVLRHLAPQSNLFQVSDVFNIGSYSDCTLRLVIDAKPRRELEKVHGFRMKGYLPAAINGVLQTSYDYYAEGLRRNFEQPRLRCV